jgi:hypothetical protein
MLRFIRRLLGQDAGRSHARAFVAMIIAVEEPPKIRNHSAFMAARQPL